MEPRSKPQVGALLAALSPLGLLLGFVLGGIAHGTQAPPALVDFISEIGRLWTNALRISVVPLSMALLIAGIAGLPSGRDLGRWTARAVVTFGGLIAVGLTVTLGLGGLYLRASAPDAVTLPLAGGASAKTAAQAGSWADSLIPPKLFDAMARNDMLAITLVSILFALALRQIDEPRRLAVLGLLGTLRDVILVFVQWVLMLLPLGAFALAFAFAAKGAGAVGVGVLEFVGFVTGLQITFLLAIYLAVLLLGRIPFRSFAGSIWPAQAVALTTRSSLASLPTMVESAQRMNLPTPATQVVLPMAVTFLKLNRTITSPSRLLFVAAVFGVVLEPAQVLVFVLTVVLLSLSTPGLPSAGTGRTLGAYVAAGLPVEGVLLFEAVNPIIDFLSTVLNVTGNLAAAVIVSRWAPGFQAVNA
ncbi:MAG TPA: cation:dicarboxylase symporter family transporter [Fimbriimonadaceae bacterium]|nr:cation:dicarboxylase symporter family transporter [Fimbriimonadaceae bacterium]